MATYAYAYEYAVTNAYGRVWPRMATYGHVCVCVCVHAYAYTYDYIDATTSKALEMLKTIYIYIVLILKELDDKLLLA